MLIKTYNEYHLGDQLHHLNYLRRVCQEDTRIECIHYCKQEYHLQLLPLCEGLPITLQDLPPQRRRYQRLDRSRRILLQKSA